MSERMLLIQSLWVERKVCLGHAGGLRCQNLFVTLHSRKRGLSSKRFKGRLFLKCVETRLKLFETRFKQFQIVSM